MSQQPPYNNQPNGNNQQYPYQPQQPYTPQQVPAFPQPAQNIQYPQPGQPFSGTPQKKRRRSIKEQWNSGTSGKCGIIFACGVLLLVVFACAGVMNAANSAGSPVATPQTAAQVVPIDTTTTDSTTAGVAPVASHYPPKTKDDLNYLAAQGDATAIHEFHSESTGLTGACPQPKREVTVDPAIVGQQLAEDVLAYFYQNQLDSPCGSLVLVYHTQSEANDVYTAGRINLDVTDASGSTNVDPNASGLKYMLTLDIGGVLTSEKEYIVSY